MEDEVQQYFWDLEHRFTNLFAESDVVTPEEQKLATARDLKEYFATADEAEIAKKLQLVHKQKPNARYQKPHML